MRKKTDFEISKKFLCAFMVYATCVFNFDGTVFDAYSTLLMDLVLFRCHGAVGVPADEQPVGLHARGDELPVRQHQEGGPNHRVARSLRRRHHRSMQGMFIFTVVFSV